MTALHKKDELMAIALDAWRSNIRDGILTAARAFGTYKTFEIESNPYLGPAENFEMQRQFAQIVLELALETGCKLFAELGDDDDDDDEEEPPMRILKPEDFIFSHESTMYLTVTWA